LFIILLLYSLGPIPTNIYKENNNNKFRNSKIKIKSIIIFCYLIYPILTERNADDNAISERRGAGGQRGNPDAIGPKDLFEARTCDKQA